MGMMIIPIPNFPINVSGQWLELVCQICRVSQISSYLLAVQGIEPAISIIESAAGEKTVLNPLTNTFCVVPRGRFWLT
jgi:hypothetical protein